MEMEQKVPVFDWDKGEFVRGGNGAVAALTGVAAVEQIVIKAQQTTRGVHMIYASDDPALHHKYGSDAGAVLAADGLTQDVRVSELQRAVSDAVQYDPFVSGVSEVQIEKGADGYVASFSVESIYGTAKKEVPIR